MTIHKGEKIYTVSECKTHWTIKRTEGKLEISFTLDKALAPDTDALKAIVLDDPTF